MTNGEKILVGVLAISLIVVILLIIPKDKNTEKNITNNVDNVDNVDIFKYIEDNKDDSNKNNIIESNNIVSENKDDNKIILGKEEQENNIEKNIENIEQKAIEMAKKEWGISINSYNFEATNSGDGIYDVSVISKTSRTVITIYSVNVITGTITEKN